ncbi:(Dimethylallyl)adenosine tRNA methylthiotransferase MiaB [Candidatus Zixiibacteriota bacterium]|nr:(Dimethylallyl)adenosine tRNA methylthiotransferase MiaB [candidate division Zixibacteria bacterium]
MNDKSYKIVTFGCQMNLADSGVLAAVLNARGYRPAENEVEADIIILNTCSVREKAEERVFGRLGELCGLKNREPHKKIAVVGCMAQRLGDRIVAQAPYVDIVLGTDQMFNLPRILENSNGTPQVYTEFGHEEIESITPVRDSRYTAYVTISRGCGNFCTYCIVPYVRGEERSYPADEIVSQIKGLVSDGVLEIMLLGQNVNSYRSDDLSFAGLLKKIAGETGIKRIRFMTSHPKDLSEELISVLASEPKMMAHLHLPLQSGSDRILKRMGRRYTFDHYSSLVSKLRGAVPDISLTTDLIVGFPSETEEEFQMTLEAAEKIRFDSAFMFRYSPREGTAAYRFDDDVPEQEKIRRLTKLINLQKKISYEKNQEEIGRTRQVLVDGFSRRSDTLLKGKTEGFKTVLFVGEAAMIGTIQNIRITEADSWTLHGEKEI